MGWEYLVTDVASHGDFHGYELRVEACVHDFAEDAEGALLGC